MNIYRRQQGVEKSVPRRLEVIGEWRKIHIEELHDLYSSV